MGMFLNEHISSNKMSLVLGIYIILGAMEISSFVRDYRALAWANHHPVAILITKMLLTDLVMSTTILHLKTIQWPFYLQGY